MKIYASTIKDIMSEHNIRLDRVDLTCAELLRSLGLIYTAKTRAKFYYHSQRDVSKNVSGVTVVLNWKKTS